MWPWPNEEDTTFKGFLSNFVAETDLFADFQQQQTRFTDHNWASNSKGKLTLNRQI